MNQTLPKHLDNDNDSSETQNLVKKRPSIKEIDQPKKKRAKPADKQEDKISKNTGKDSSENTKSEIKVE